MKSLFSIIVAAFLAVFVLCCSDDSSPEKKAINLAGNFIMENGASAEKNIEKMVNDGGSDIKPIGWDVEVKGDQVYLVSYKYRIYSYEKGIGERGYFFKVDLKNGVVYDVTELYLQQMKPLSAPYTNDQDIMKDLIGDSVGAMVK